MEPLVRAFAEVGVRHLTTQEPSLEELFVRALRRAPNRVDERCRDPDGARLRGTAPATRTRSAEVVVARRAFKQVWVAAAVWALAFGETVAAQRDHLREQLSRPRNPGAPGRDDGA